MAIAIGLHLLATIVWVGGMFFAHMVLRPSVAEMEAPQRLALFSGVLQRFFSWVWLAVVTLLLSGYWMVFVQYNGFAGLPVHLHLMHGIGLLMCMFYLHLWFAPYRRFKLAIVAQDFPEAGRRLGQIRLIVLINLILGLANSLIGASGIYI
jgi:uncharacterized membrane protein